MSPFSKEHRHASVRKGGTVDLGKGLRLPKAFNATFYGPELPCRVSLDLEFEDGRLECKELKCTVRDGDDELTSEAIRQIPVRLLIQEAAEYVLQDEVPRKRVQYILEDLDYQTLVSRGPTPETLEWVAVIYRFAYACHDDPTKSVVERFGIPRSTAGRWVAKAREQGFLGPAADRRAGEH